jgi:hypothetical protein
MIREKLRPGLYICKIFNPERYAYLSEFEHEIGSGGGLLSIFIARSTNHDKNTVISVWNQAILIL